MSGVPTAALTAPMGRGAAAVCPARPRSGTCSPGRPTSTPSRTCRAPRLPSSAPPGVLRGMLAGPARWELSSYLLFDPGLPHHGYRGWPRASNRGAPRRRHRRLADLTPGETRPTRCNQDMLALPADRHRNQVSEVVTYQRCALSGSGPAAQIRALCILLMMRTGETVGEGWFGGRRGEG